MIRWVLVVLVPAAVFAAESGLDGRVIEVTGGGQTSVDAPLILPYDGADASGVVSVEQSDTGKQFPAAARAGEFVFVPEGTLPGKTHRYTVKVSVAKRSPVVTLTKHEGEDVIDIDLNGELFTAYHYSNDNKKPFLWPVNAEGGQTITRDWPMGEKQLTDDHKHHMSLWTSYGDVNGVDCWAEEENSGYQHSGDVQFGSGDAYGWISAKNVWQDKDHKPVVTEEREYRFYAGKPSARLVDVTVTFRADYGDVKFGDTKEGGLVSVRMTDALREQSGGGKVTTSEGVNGSLAAWGKPAAWCDYSGTLEGIGVRGITVFDNPTNLRYPTSWHVRNYGLMGANCFGYSHFTNGKQNGDYLLENGKSVTFHYRVFVHSGDATDAKVSDRFADYATPPAARWVE